MKSQTRTILVLALLGSLLLVGAAVAAPTAVTLHRFVIGGGGGRAEAGIYTLDGTIGQAVVGVESATLYDLCSGYWCGEGAVIYLPLVLRE